MLLKVPVFDPVKAWTSRHDFDKHPNKPEFPGRFGNLGLNSGYANLQIGGLQDAIQENGVPGIAPKK